MKKRIISVLPLVVVISFGCSKSGLPNSARVSGNVTYKGKDGVAKPVTAGTLIFFTKNAGNYPIVIRADGTYSTSDIPLGEIVVTVETESANPKNKPPEYGGGKDDEKKPKFSPRPDSAKGGGKAGAYVKIPQKYADKKTSGLTVTLNAGAQKQDFELTD
jgi:hypothetical protein